MAATRLILVGGFLGAGKTSLLQAAALRLAEEGKRVGVVTNDQAPDLVDTQWLAQSKLGVREVAGSCFCCNFPGLLDAASALRNELAADVLLCEPVGSCTDLSATLLQPLKARYAQDFSVSPLSVLVDPFRLLQVAAGTSDLHPSAAYIHEKQLEEADAIVVTKTDLLDDEQREAVQSTLSRQYPDHTVHWLSSQTGAGLAEWLAAMQAGTPAGARIAEVDYDTYAEGEAVLGWFNAEYRIDVDRCCLPDWAPFCRNLLETLRLHCRANQTAIGHIKLLMEAEEGHVVGNVTSLARQAEVRGELEPFFKTRLVLNARAQMAPADLEVLIDETLKEVAGPCVHIVPLQVHSLQPGRPEPTHRYADVVETEQDPTGNDDGADSRQSF